jgi:putative heme-binding domain-containing protein
MKLIGNKALSRAFSLKQPPFARRFDSRTRSTLLSRLSGCALLAGALASAFPSARAAARVATPADQISVLDGFQVELIRSAEPNEGSWVSMAVDPKGRLIVSPQEGTGNMLRITLSPQGQVAGVEQIHAPVGSAMGLLYAFDSLYVSGKGPDGLALYRLRDKDNDDQFESVELIRKFDGAGGEHGSHAVVLGPDNKLYYVHGNFVKQPKDISPNSPHQHYAEDQLLPRGEDGNGFGVGIKPPGGFVVRMDPGGKNCELFAAGLRNTYDIAFNPDGELFGFDSDMEWDWGMPWYRPIRINHLVSGGDYGFREGTGKFPEYYADTLPATVNVGIGSPTGVKFGTRSSFPDKYRAAMFAMDWSYGRILAVHLTPDGATYSGSFENFVAPASLHATSGPKATLNVTDLEFGRDGAMYFTTGGRGTQSGLYRVSAKSPVAVGAPLPADHDDRAAAARKTRRQLEAFHGRKDPAALEAVWPHLDSKDRWIRYAARIAIESQPVEQWQDRALREDRPQAALTALLALARMGSPDVQPQLFDALDHLPWSSFTEAQNLEGLRVMSLSFIRMGRPDSGLANDIVQAVEPYCPAKTWPLNHELSQILIYLQAPSAAEKTLALLDSAATQEEQLYYLFQLRTLKAGWTLQERRHYFEAFDRDWKHGRHTDQVLSWFTDAGRGYDNGASFPKFLAFFRKDAIASLTEQERTALVSFITRPALPLVQANIAPRAFVKEWSVEDLLPVLDQVSQGRDLQKGQKAFAAAQCVACHQFGGDGGAVGPDLTAVTSRFSRRDILESMVQPSKVVSEQYQNMTIFKKDGDDVTGRVVEDTPDKLVVVINPLTQDKVQVRKSDIRDQAPSKISPMPEGLLNTFSKDEILDLLAYIESAGKEQHAAAGK